MSTLHLAIDPMALMLSDSAYLIWVELNHPHEPAVATIEQLVKRMAPEERKMAASRAAGLAAYANALRESITRVSGDAIPT